MKRSRRQLGSSALAGGLALLLASAGGCESQEERIAMAQVEHHPLPLDPMEPYDIARWWSNGVDLLRLDEVGSYALYADDNRYRPPRQRGRWSQLSYAELRLEPYEALRAAWIRVGVSRVDGRIALAIRDLDPMFALTGPPRVPEDEIVGTWRSAHGTLTLGPGARYAYQLDAAREPVTIAGHRGAWRLEGDRLRLAPDTPMVGPMVVTVTTVEGGPAPETLVIAGGDVFRRTDD